jgi:glycerate kinase
MTVLIAPDKFKGSLDTFELCKAMAAGVQEADASINSVLLPLADGGDGFAKVMAHYLDTVTISQQTVDAAGKPIDAAYEWSEDTQTAIIELAVASGIALLKSNELNPLRTSTYGTGLLVKAAIQKGAKKVILGLGGSATNDGGMGLLAAIGYQFLDSGNNVLSPCGASLEKITLIKSPEESIDVEFVIACDVTNPLLGINGAAFTYAAQKGASEKEIVLLENGMRNFGELLEKKSGKSIIEQPGSGAAGGTCAGLLLLPKSSIQKGMNIVLSYSNFKQHLAEAALVITGEGAFDYQTLNGKVVFAVATLAKASGVPAIAICGKVAADFETIKACGLAYIVSICNRPMSYEESKQEAYELVLQTTANIITLMNETANWHLPER